MSDDPASAEAFRWELEQAIEPTKGEVLDVLNNYLNSGSRDTFHQILIGRAIAEIKHLRRRLLAEENAYDILRLENEHLQTDRNNLALEVERLNACIERLRFGWDCYKNYINYKENTNG